MKNYYIAMGMSLMLATPAVAQDATLVFTALDANKDGKVSQAEAQRNTMVSEIFSTADKDHDGFLSKDEFMAAFGKNEVRTGTPKP
jgi:Ca2+-binding EF-hand superfamily protein